LAMRYSDPLHLPSVEVQAFFIPGHLDEPDQRKLAETTAGLPATWFYPLIPNNHFGM